METYREKVQNIIEKYYEQIDENSRLVKDKVHKIEFLTTTKYIDKYLKKGDKILEIGAGTGRYSLYYAKKGYKVESVELTNSNIKVFKNQIEKGMDIKVHQGNALNLEMFEDNSFDVTLLLGPLYHLFKEEDRNQAIKEAIRVTKKGGIIYLAYITNDAVILSYGLRKGNLLRLKEFSKEGYKIKDIPEEIFSVSYVKDFEKIINKFKVKKLNQVATDGIAPNMANYINELTEEEYEVWLDYHFSNCEREDIMGYSSHVLYICRKE